MENVQKPQTGKFYKGQFLPVLLLALILMVLIGIAGYLYYQNQKTTTLLQNLTTAKPDQIQSVIDKVGKLIQLPQNDIPQVAMVHDISKLKGQAFFANAKNGDIILIYPIAKKAILYDPTTNKIIEVGPVSSGNANTANISPTQTLINGPSVSSAPSQAPYKIAVYNGTTDAVYFQKQLDLLKKTIGITVVSSENAAKNTYDKTIVVDINSTHADETAAVAEAVHGQVYGQLPSGEQAPEGADILVIIGGK